MAGTVHMLPRHERDEFVLGHDGFAARVTHPGEPMFWIRVEAGAPGEAVVTDLSAGPVRRSDAAAQLARALAQAVPDGISTVRLTDLLPHGGPPERARAAAVEAAEVLTPALSLLGLAPDAPGIVQRRGKYDLIVSVQDA